MGITNLDRLQLANGLEFQKITESFVFGDFTDGGSTTGTVDLTATIPAGATVLRAVLTTLVGFAGDTSATIQIGDGTDVDRYSTGTPDVFSDVAGGADLGIPSGAAYHAATATITITITTAADFTSVSAGGFTIDVLYFE